MPAVAPGSRRLDIQGLRAFAVLIVVCFHAGLPLPGGFVGVDIFFVISGYVITEMLSREWGRSGQIRFRAFYARRFRRLTPALATVVTLTVILSAVLQSPLGVQQVTAQTSIGALLLSANIVIGQVSGGYFDPAAETNPLLNTWSLSVEEQFYLAFPFLLVTGWLIARRIHRGRGWPFAIVAVVGLASFSFAIAASRGLVLPGVSDSFITGFYSPMTRAWEFAAGALLALVIHRRQQPDSAESASTLGCTRLVSLSASALGAAMLLVSVTVVLGSPPYPRLTTLMPVVGTMLLLFGGHCVQNPITKALSMRPAVLLGNVSYSWYLWHWPIIVFTAILLPDHPELIALVAFLSLLPAIGSYSFIEEPIRRLQAVGTGRMTGIVLVTMVPPLVLASMLWVAADHGFWNQKVMRYQFAAAMHEADVRGCVDGSRIGGRPPDACTWNVNGNKAPLYLVGDSHADHFSEALIGTAESLNSPLTISAIPSCPFADLYISDRQHSEIDCRSPYELTMSWIVNQPPGVVVVAQTDSYWDSISYEAGQLSTTLSSDPAVKDAAFRSGLKRTVEALQTAGHRVLLVQTIPHFSNQYRYDPGSCSLPELASGSCDVWMPLTYAQTQQASGRSALLDVARDSGALLLDPGPSLCPVGACSTDAGEFVTYRDNNHMSAAASEHLTEFFAAALRSLLR